MKSGVRGLIFIGLFWGQGAIANETTGEDAFSYATGLSTAQRQLMNRDVESLHFFRFSDIGSPNFRSFIKVPRLSAELLTQWLKARARYIVKVSPAGYSAVKVAPVMVNLGVILYREAKEAKRPKQYDIEGIGRVMVRTPRVGILEVWPGLFGLSVPLANTKERMRMNSIIRLGTLFHEARHSDGIQNNVGFPHIPCPKGHDWAGAYACDAPINGAYGLEGEFLKEILLACQDCSAAEKNFLRLLIADSLNRVISLRTGKPEVWDDRAEGFLK